MLLLVLSEITLFSLQKHPSMVQYERYRHGGVINHSRKFARKFVSPVYDVLVKRLRVLLSKPLPCTGDVSPIVILGDKGTVKRDVTQPTIIRLRFPGEKKSFSKVLLVASSSYIAHRG